MCTNLKLTGHKEDFTRLTSWDVVHQLALLIHNDGIGTVFGKDLGGHVTPWVLLVWSDLVSDLCALSGI